MNLDKFKSQVNRDGLAKNNRWEVRIYPPKALSSIASGIDLAVGKYGSLNLPGLDLTNIPLLQIESADKRLPDVSASFDLPSFGFTTINSGSFIERINLYCNMVSIPEREIKNVEWREYGESRQLGVVHEHKGVNMSYYCSEDLQERFFFEKWTDIIFNPNNKRRSYYQDYTSRIEIIKYNTSWSKQEAIYRLNEAYPTNIAAQNMVHDEASLLRLDVAFKYRNYERIK